MMSGFLFELVIPEGLTIVPGSCTIPSNLKTDLDLADISYTESSKIFMVTANTCFDLTAETQVMSFQCTVNEGATGAQVVDFAIVADDVFDFDFNNIPFTATGATVTVEEVAPCTHDWAAADCDTPKTCKLCGVTEGVALGHDWEAADCDTAKTCKVCGVTEGSALGHDWEAADCDTAKTCKVCGATEGSALGHSWDSADCTTAKTCTVCGATVGEAVGHDWAAADCDNPKTCKLCGATEGSALGHNWTAADCQNPKTCEVCGATEGEKVDHVDANNDAKCDVCGYEENVKTGDVSMMGFVAVILIATVCCAIVVCNKKRITE